MEEVVGEVRMDWYTYEIPPIDFGWENLKTVKQTLSDIAKDSPDGQTGGDVDSSAIQSFLSTWESAKAAAKTAGWEGDFRDDPAVIWLPSHGAFTYGFVVKQDN